jgi:hypothetical protein
LRFAALGSRAGGTIKLRIRFFNRGHREYQRSANHDFFRSEEAE